MCVCVCAHMHLMIIVIEEEIINLNAGVSQEEMMTHRKSCR